MLMFRKIIVIVLVFGYAVVFGEMFVRLFNPQPLMPRYVTDHEDGVRQNIAGAVYRQTTPEVSVEIRINNQGFRADREYSLVKPVDVYRILLLGDSFFMGYEVELEDSLQWLLEQKLAEHSIKAEVINLSVSGFSTAESLVALDRGLKFQPDLVILQWHASDPIENIRAGLFEADPDLNIRRIKGAYLPGIEIRNALMKIYGYQWLIGNSHLYSAVRESAAGFVKNLLDRLNTYQARMASEPANSSQTPELSAPAGSEPELVSVLNEALIKAVANKAANVDADTILFDVPGRISRTHFESALGMIDSSLIDEITIVSPIDDFRHAADPEKKLYWEEGHGHWTVEGNQIAAERLATAVLQKIAIEK